MQPMALDPMQLPNDVATLKALLVAEHAARIASDTRALEAETRAKDLDAEIESLKLTIAKLQRDKYGASSERARLLDQLELQLGELVERRAQEAAADEIAASLSAATGKKPPRQKPARRPLPSHLPRERVMHAPPTVCPCCTGTNFRKLGADETESLERIPAQWKVVVHVREKMACRTCDTIVQAPAPSHPIARGRAGPHLLTEVVFSKFRAHQPLNRQSDIFAKEGVDLDVSTLADWVGACAATLMPLRDAIEAHVHAAARIHVDDTTVPVLAKGKCRTGRLWGHVRDDRPFGGKAATSGLDRARLIASRRRDGSPLISRSTANTSSMRRTASIASGALRSRASSKRGCARSAGSSRPRARSPKPSITC